jgi:DNA-binding XRE family transcriptional regulator
VSKKGQVQTRITSLRWARKTLRNMTQSELAQRATGHLQQATGDTSRGISESFIALLETDRRDPSLENAVAIAAALDVPVEIVFDVAGENGRPDVAA